MVLTKSEMAAIVDQVRAEMLPVLRDEIRAELAIQARRDAERRDAPRLLRIDEVCARTGYRPTKIWSMSRLGLFPEKVKVGPKCTVWREHEVNEWVERHAA